ncbi:hypothetical protein GCM10010425_49000 [Streptomyces spororaveus]|uniref:Uncharacterized protein n=1 Tax=Streptomyces spororaveus TaxID=284039 RepID=A0ABQ3T274_9ACTN|nr:hypothetical protein Sspor_00550 [Streptomyces spororaveus]
MHDRGKPLLPATGHDAAFYVARPDVPREDTITVQTRSGIRHLPVLGAGRGGPDRDPAVRPGRGPRGHRRPPPAQRPERHRPRDA